MSYTSIVALLKTALLLLTLAQGPNVPKSLHDQAVSVANQAIAAATAALAKAPNATTTPQQSSGGNGSQSSTQTSIAPSILANTPSGVTSSTPTPSNAGTVNYTMQPSNIFSSKSALLRSGTTYADTVPDTLDLAERASSYIKGQIQTIAPTLHSSPAGWVGGEQVPADFWGCKMTDKRPCLFYNWPNWGLVMRALAQAREMSSYDRSDADHTVETQYRMLTNMIDPKLQSDFAKYFNGSMLVQAGPCTTDACISAPLTTLEALMEMYRQDPRPELKNAIDALVSDLIGHRTAFPDGAKTYMAFAWPKNDSVETGIGYLGDYYGPYINGKALEEFSQWYLLSGNTKALSAANDLSDFTRNYQKSVWWRSPEPARFADGSGHFAGHIYSWLQLALGMTAHAEALRKSNPQDALATAEIGLANDTYVFIKNRTFPSRVGNMGEIGTTGDMVKLAIRLSRLGAAYYYEDAEAWTRNELAEAQIDASGAGYIPNNQGSTYENTLIGTKITGMFFADATHIFSIPNKNLFATTDYAPNALGGMHAVWENAVVNFNNFAQINFLLNRASQYLDVRSELPYRGRVVIATKPALGPITDFGLRIPSWVDRSKIVVSILAGTTETPLAPSQWSWISGAPYVQVKNLKPSTTYVVAFPVAVSTETVYELRTPDSGWYEGSYPGSASQQTLTTYAAKFRGDTLVDAPGRPTVGIPRYQRDLLSQLPDSDSAAPTITRIRFVSGQ